MAEVADAPEVSGIICVHNGERFLAEAIDSVLGQTGVDVELIVVDDGSTDGSAAIVRDYEARHPGRVRLVSHPGGENRGISASRNLGISHARGRFIAFNDADDVWTPRKCLEQLAIFKAHPEVGVVYGRVLIWHSWSGTAGPKDHFVSLGVVPNHVYRPVKLFEILVENRHQTPTPCCTLIRREMFEKLGGFEPSFRVMFEDTTFFAKALATTPAYVSDKFWCKYRQHPSSATAVSNAAGRDERARLTLLLWLRKSIRQYTTDTRVDAAIQLAIRHAMVRLVRGPLGRFRRKITG